MKARIAMDLNTPQAVIEGRTTSVKRADVESWLREAAVKVKGGKDTGTNTVLIHPSIPGGYKSLPFPLDGPETIRGTHLSTIAHLCKRIMDDLARASGTYVDAGDDLPNWLAPLFRDGPFGMSIEGNRLTIYSKKYPEFQKAIDLNKGEAGVSHELKQMQGQIKAYVTQMDYYEEAGWKRETLGSEIRLLPPEDSQEQPIALTGSIGQLFSSLKHRDLTGFAREAPEHIEIKPFVEEVIADPSEVEPVTVAGAPNPPNKPRAEPSKTFIISEDCPLAQRKMFEAMNRQLEVFGIKKADFDLEFRLGLMKQCVDLAKAPAFALLRSLDAKTRAEFLRQDKRARAFNLSAPTNQAQLMDFMASLYMGVTLNPPNPSPQDCSVILTNIEASAPGIANGIVKYYMEKFGRFQDIDPTRLSPEERIVFDQFNALVSGEAKSSTKQSDELILDTIARSGALINGSNELAWQIGNDQIHTVGLPYHTIVPLGLSVGKATEKLGLPIELLKSEEPKAVLQEVMTSMMSLMGLDPAMLAAMSMSDMSGLAALTSVQQNTHQPTLAPYLTDGAQGLGAYSLTRQERRAQDRALRKQVAREGEDGYTPPFLPQSKPREVPPEVLARLEAEKAARAREAEQQLARLAELEAARPTPYALEKSAADVFRRIEKVSEDDWSVIRNPEAAERRQQEIVRMRYLHKQELVPLHNLLNTKFPMHAEFGEVFFSEPVLKRAEYACAAIPEGKEKPIVQLNGLGAKLASLLAQLTNVKADELPESQRVSYQSIIRQLANCPALVIAALGDDQQLKSLRTLNNQILSRDALAPVARNFVAAETAEWVKQRAALAREILVARGIQLPEVAPVASTTQPHNADKPDLQAATASDVGQVTQDVPTVVPAIAAAAAIDSIPSASNDVVLPSVETEEETLYDVIRAEQKQRRDYSEAQTAALSSARYKADDFVKQKECRELECRLQTTKYGYEIHLIFGKDGKANPIERIPLKGVQHIDDAMDIFLAVESTLFDEYSKERDPTHYIEPALRGLVMPRDGSTPKPRVKVIDILRDEKSIPQGVVDLDPKKVQLVNEQYATAEPPKKQKAFTEAKVINSGETATLVIQSWFKSERGKARTCAQVTVPLGVDFAQADEVKYRAEFVINHMQQLISTGKFSSPREVMHVLREHIQGQDGKTWHLPKTLHVDGHETAKKLNFPAPEHQQETMITAGILTRLESKETGPYYSLQFRMNVKDLTESPPLWRPMVSRTINLMTADRTLADERAKLMMDQIKDFFERTLREGDADFKTIALPANYRWSLGPDQNGVRYLTGDRRYGAKAQRLAQNTVNTKEAILDWHNVDALIDHAVGHYIDDYTLQPVAIEQGDKQTQFTLRLVRGTRVGSDKNEGTSETALTRNEYAANDHQPVEVTFLIDNNTRTTAQLQQRIAAFAHDASQSLQSRLFQHYATTSFKGGSYLLKGSPEFRGDKLITELQAAIRSHLMNFEDMEVDRNRLNDAMRKPYGMGAKSNSGATTKWAETVQDKDAPPEIGVKSDGRQ